MTDIDYVPIKTCKAALERATEEQSAAIDRLMRDWKANSIFVGVDLGLPEGYLCFTVNAQGGRDIYGGIAPDGSVST